MSLGPYPSLEDVWARAAAMAPLVDYGRSVEGRPLRHVTLPGEGPLVCVTAGLHGLEWIGVQVALAVLEAGPLPGARLRVFPVLNPDGYARTERQGGHGTVGELRCNARGVDLNRNFPLPWQARPSRIPFAGASEPGAATYRGPAPLSEPETRALTDVLHAEPPHASANLHSFMGTLIAARVWHLEDWRAYGQLCRAFRHAQGGWGYRRLGTPVFDVFTGELEDWQHHVLGCWGVCVECFSVVASLRQHRRAPSAFWRFNPARPAEVVARDAPAVRALLQHSLTLPPPRRCPQGIDALPHW